MTDLGALDAYLKLHLSPHRYQHCLGVAETARELALRYHADADRAYLAGLAHDMSKWMKGQDFLIYAEKYGLAPDPFQKEDPSLLHADISACLLTDLFGETDEQVLSAIRLHQCGAPNMRLLDACVCLADWIEPGRQYDDIPALRELARQSLELALHKAFATTICLLLESGRVVYPRSLETYNSLTRMIQRKEVFQ